MERSPYFIRNTFNKNDFINNHINEDEYNVINEMYQKTDKIWKSNFYIYLRSSPKKCLERIKTRGRENEINIDEDYLMSIHDLHEEAYLQLLETNKNVILIDIENKTIEEIIKEIVSLI
jgi:deoxyadenosine/deoxycytidine kinase